MRKSHFVMLKRVLIMISLLLSFSLLYADPKVISVIMNPTNPGFGDVVNITVTYCSQLYNAAEIAIDVSSVSTKQSADLSGVGQVFVVSRAGVDVATSQPALTQGGEMGWVANPNPNGGTSNCTDCASQNGSLHTNVYQVHIPPATYFPGCNVTQLYLQVGMKDNNMSTSDWASRPACSSEPSTISWPIPTIPKGFISSKMTEGVLQQQNDLVLFSVDYTYYNGNLTITDPLPGGGDLSLVSWGPQTIPGGSTSGQPVGATSGTITWNLPDKSGQPGETTGTVWMLMKINVATPVMGKTYTNTATVSQSGSASQLPSASTTVGQAAISLTKSEGSPMPNFGDTETYYLTYNVNGQQLVAYQPFDDITSGIYGQLNGTGGTPVPGWSFSPQAGTNGQWTVSDPCLTGDHVITGDAGAANQFPSLLFNGIPATDHMCSGVIQTDVYINPIGYEGADALVLIRSDGLASGNAYALVLSVDTFIGTNNTGHVGFQRCNAVEGCEWPLSNNSAVITGNKWWSVKIQIGPLSQYQFSAKVWARGDPEPSGWGITWTDPSPTAADDCNNGQNWRPGFGEQHGATGDTQDSYDNFVVFNPRTVASTVIWDTVPNSVGGISDGSITYVGQQGPYPVGTNGPNLVSWNLGSISNEGGTFTWWGVVNSCNPITNDCWINGAAPMVAEKSNQVIAIPVCPTPVIELIKTANVTTAKVGDIVTFTLSACNYSASTTTINPFNIWDTIPSCITYGGSTGGPTKAGSLLVWSFPALTPGGATPTGTACTGNVTWYGTINSAGGCMINLRDYFASFPVSRKIEASADCGNRQ
jgi:uncharacterized repeat protein (TIGR01451 family)